MKPKDLKPLFFSNDKSVGGVGMRGVVKVVVHERIWMVPRIENDPFVFEGFSSERFFGNDHPVHLEYCSGNGLWIVEKAKANPLVNWIGVEIKWKRIRKIWSKIHNHHLPNLMAVHTEAFYMTNKYLQGGTIDKIYINFPDPWPKTRHAKYRLVQPLFILEMARVLKEGGELMIVTDDPFYSKQIIKGVIDSKLFVPNIESPYYTVDYPDYGSSYFEELWRRKEKEIRYHLFVKR